jgi:heme/copper-type cytochrome/quinol oxidase subunit 2
MKLSKNQVFIGLLLGLAGVLIAFAPLPVRAVAPAQRTFQVEASQFAYLPAVLHVNPGDTVTIELVSTDVVHGLYLDGYGVSITADPGQTARLTFTADRPGSYRFRCNVTCGALHPFMIGKIQVGPDITLLRGIALTVLAAIAGIFFFPRPAKVQAA